MVSTGGITWCQHQQPPSQSLSDWCSFSDGYREDGNQPLAPVVAPRFPRKTPERHLR
jgi:hypothetical protein